MQTEKVSFYSEGVKLAGVLHKPDNQTRELFPIIVQGPGWLETVCSRVSEPFHEGFVKGGYAVLHWSPPGFGDSGGEPGWILWQDQVEDILNALTYVETRKDLDSQRIGLFGHGGTGGGNPIYAAAADPRPKCVVVQTVVADGIDWLRGMRREYEWVELIERVGENARRRVLENEDTMVDPTEELMVATPERKRVGMPTRGKEFHLSSAESLLRYRPLEVVDRIAPRGLLLSCIENDVVTPERHAQRLYEKARAPKKLIRQTGVSHYEAYTKNYEFLMSQFLDWYNRFLVSGYNSVRLSEPIEEILTF